MLEKIVMAAVLLGAGVLAFQGFGGQVSDAADGEARQLAALAGGGEVSRVGGRSSALDTQALMNAQTEMNAQALMGGRRRDATQDVHLVANDGDEPLAGGAAEGELGAAGGVFMAEPVPLETPPSPLPDFVEPPPEGFGGRDEPIEEDEDGPPAPSEDDTRRPLEEFVQPPIPEVGSPEWLEEQEELMRWCASRGWVGTSDTVCPVNPDTPMM